MNDLHLGILSAVTFLSGAASLTFLVARHDTVAFVFACATILGVVIFVVRDRHND